MLIAAATLAARRWGPVIGGAFAGLPLSSGPISVFLFLEQGRAFAAGAARASVLGLVGVAAFCAAYAYAARRRGPVASLGAGYAAYFAATAASFFFRGGIAATAFVVAIVLVAAVRTIEVPPERPAARPTPRWDLPMRIVTATAMVLAITALASRLGPTWTGLLSPFPIFSSVLAAFAHVSHGASAAVSLQRGILLGNLGFGAFFVVVALLLPKAPAAPAYAAAAGAAIAISVLSVLVANRVPREPAG